ncbi:beta-glucosidase BglX [Acuticoccus mangrovi]|uniref:beta-glucosidase n=1 Tax=Acuticoccus mangrovi TaxID=2796142 RepID=A0A934MI61_9HYPH|nr:beta-glucosidase BglX [Acuticoccus mangrovi]MBJ3777610.1 beta-glucosidase BglX [Acuticoccus mangrovi]
MTTDRIAALMARMTLAEKIGQLNLLSAGEGPETGSAAVGNIRGRLEKGRLGAIFGTKSVVSVRAWQELALAGSRHAIPLFFAEDVIHGHRTVFPLPIALAGAFSPAVWEATARVAAREAAAEGIKQVYAPMIDIARDPRWGRVAESPGEDPYLASRYAEATVRGLEGDDLTRPDTVVACLKHFLAYGAAVGGRDYDNASLSAEELIGVYAEPFRAGVAAGAGSVMAAFNAVNKRPMHAHRPLIEGWLRGKAGFDGLLVADYTGIAELSAHGLGDGATVTALALLAGVDMDMIGENYLHHLPRLAVEGLDAPEAGLSIAAGDICAAVDRACTRVLTLKERLGLFDDPFRYCDEARATTTALSPEHRRVARDAIAESTVLLKNDGVLPLRTGARVALVGAMADDRTNVLGTWAVSGDQAAAVTFREGLQAHLEEPLTCVKGADIVDDPELAHRLNVHGQTVFLDDRPAALMVEEAVAAARAADVVVAVVGEAREYSGECSSRTDLDLPPPQQRLVEALAATGTPLVLVVQTGRPLALERETALASAVVLAWFAGTEAGNGIADVLTGTEPGGRLAITFPARTGQVPVLYAAEPTGRPYPGHFEKFKTGYVDLPDTIPPATGLFPFGFGLSYTTFDYAAPTVERDRLAGDDTARVRVVVTNTGVRRGSTVVQLYVSDPVARITRPMIELKGFKKIVLDPGETREVAFSLTRRDLAYAIGEEPLAVEWVWDPGVFVFRTGPNARDLQSVAVHWDG